MEHSDRIGGSDDRDEIISGGHETRERIVWVRIRSRSIYPGYHSKFY